GAKYDTPLDRQSAQEILSDRAEQAARAGAEARTGASPTPDDDLFDMKQAQGSRGRRYEPSAKESSRTGSRSRSSRSDTVLETFGKSLARQLGTKSGQALVRGVLGSLFRGR
ncbi:MAG: helicase HerA-like domain-containing protein, partial [Paracoccus sp. (in: a-proteobacteria)]